jgi:hypothetical protein
VGENGRFKGPDSLLSRVPRGVDEEDGIHGDACEEGFR